jgi:superfamily II DNA or RNA helicase
MLRTHQLQFQQVCARIKSSKELRKVIVHVVPGGGKSALPVIAAHELIPYVCDAIAWITPRTNLRDQAEEAFTKQFLIDYLGHNNEIRSTTNDADLLRDKIGYATTYQALVTAARLYQTNPHTKLFGQKEIALFLDEPNHLLLGDEYYQAVLPLAERAKILVLMGGVLTRNDSGDVGFLDYLDKDENGRRYVNLNQSPTQAVIRYSLKDATREHAIIKIDFDLCDCEAEWKVVAENGMAKSSRLDSLEGASKAATKTALYTALETDFAEAMLRSGADFCKKRQRRNPRSRLIVVAARISQAKSALKILEKLGIKVDIATSDDSAEARDNIERFKEGKLDALVTVAMAYEGMDVPEADVLICLTHIRSREWIEQMIHRVTRFDNENPLPWESQFATIFAPRDRFFLEIMQEMNAEQAPFVAEVQDGNGGGGGEPTSKLQPQQSKLTSHTTQSMDGSSIEPDMHQRILDAMDAVDIRGAISMSDAQKFLEAVVSTSVQPVPTAADIEPNAANKPKSKEPPRRREKKLRDQIVGLQRGGYVKGDLESQERIVRRGKAIWKIFGKKLEELTEAQLQKVLEYQRYWIDA